MKHTHVNNIKEYADAAERAVIDIQRVAMMYRKNPNELTRWDLQQLVGELYTKSCALLYESSMISVEEIEEAKKAKQ
jgi:hypothetical protein